jgi:hypothetical protein
MNSLSPDQSSKRGRGRPRKHPLEKSPSKSPPTSYSPQEMSRGRPRAEKISDIQIEKWEEKLKSEKN